MSNITKELSRSKDSMSTEISQNNALMNVKLIEAGESAEDLRIALALGKKNAVSRKMDETGKLLQLEKLDGKYAGNVFRVEQIKALAMKYDMRFLQSRHYCGDIDLSVITKLKRFNKETSTEIGNGNLQYNFYILAPERCFHLKTVPRRMPDPALFYKIDDEHYRLIHQWGSDFNIFDRFRGLNWANRKSKYFFTLVKLLMFGLIGMLAYDEFIGFNKDMFFNTNLYWILPPIMAGLSAIYAFTDLFWVDGEFGEQKWDSDERIE